MKKRSVLSYLDPAINSRARSRLLQATLRFGRRLDWANGAYAAYENPILLLGSARGGTTLLANILGTHPEVYIFHERFTRGKRSFDETFGASTEPAELKRSFLQFIPHNIKAGNRRWGIKIVTHIWKREDYERFIEAFPKLQIVFVVRDGRDTVLSILNRSPYIHVPEEAFERWLESVQVLDYLRTRAADRLISYHYEDLVREPEATVRRVCGFLNLPFLTSMLDYRCWPGMGSYEPVPISADSVNKWKEQRIPPVPPELSARFERALETMGYATQNRPERSQVSR